MNDLVVEKNHQVVARLQFPCSLYIVDMNSKMVGTISGTWSFLEIDKNINKMGLMIGGPYDKSDYNS